MTTEFVAVVLTILFTIATSLVVGRYMFKVFTGGRTLLDPILVPIERLVLRVTGVDPSVQQDWKQVLGVAARLERHHVARDVRDRVRAEVVAAQSGRHRQHGADARVQHDLELHDEHEPPALQRRDGAVVPLADVRDQLSAVCDGRDRCRRVHRDDSRPGGQPARAPRQLLRRSHARNGPRVPAARGAGLRDCHVAGHANDVRRRRSSHDPRRARAGDRPRRDGGCRLDQTARHQRRRLFRAQLRASLRKPDAVLEPGRNLVDHADTHGDGLDAGRTWSAGGASPW